jgi:hypothetical protein
MLSAQGLIGIVVQSARERQSFCYAFAQRVIVEAGQIGLSDHSSRRLLHRSRDTQPDAASLMPLRKTGMDLSD